MISRIRTIGPIALLAGIVASAGASGSAYGGSDDQLWILSSGNDITYFTTPISYVQTNIVTGSGTAGGTTTTNMPLSGGIYYNTNSIAYVPGDGSAYVESGEGADYFFSNSSNTAETVTLGWQGYISNTATASGNGQSWDFSQSYVLDAEANLEPFDLYYECTAPGGTATYSDFDSGTYTFTVAAGQQEYEIQTVAYNEAEVISPASTPEPAPMAALGLGALGLIVRKRRKRGA